MLYKKPKGQSKKSWLKKIAVPIFLLLSLLVVFLVFLEKTGRTNLITFKDKNEVRYNENINYNPPTDDERTIGDKVKDSIAEEENGANSPNNLSDSGNKKSVKPVISAWSQDRSGNLRINGFIQGTIENNGTCEYALSKDGIKVVESRNGMINAQDTTCGQIIISRSKLSKGSWKAILHYNSPTSEGSSNETTIEIN